MIQFSKKASLNLSINAIVIVVLAMTLLGLGLGFIRNIFTGLEEQREEVTEQVRSQILEDLRTGNKKLSFPSTEVNIDRKKSKTLALGVKNTKAIEKLDFGITVNILQAQVGPDTFKLTDAGWVCGTLSGCTTDPSEYTLKVNFFYNQGPFKLGVTESNVYTVRTTAIGTAGTYMAKISLLEQSTKGGEYDKIYAEKTFFINIIS